MVLWAFVDSVVLYESIRSLAQIGSRVKGTFLVSVLAIWTYREHVYSLAPSAPDFHRPIDHHLKAKELATSAASERSKLFPRLVLHLLDDLMSHSEKLF